MITRLPGVPAQVERNRGERDQYDRSQGGKNHTEKLGSEIVLGILHFAVHQ